MLFMTPLACSATFIQSFPHLTEEFSASFLFYFRVLLSLCTRPGKSQVWLIIAIMTHFTSRKAGQGMGVIQLHQLGVTFNSPATNHLWYLVSNSGTQGLNLGPIAIFYMGTVF